MPRRPVKKKATKKKAATASQGQKQAASAPQETDTFDVWAESLSHTTSSCSVCRDAPAAKIVEKLLGAMIRKRAFKVQVKDILAAVHKHHPNTDVGQRGLERHLRTCVRSLYFRARGRKNV